MPIPKTKNVHKIVDFLKKENKTKKKKRSKSQIWAIALDVARKAGAMIPKKKKTKKKSIKNKK